MGPLKLESCSVNCLFCVCTEKKKKSRVCTQPRLCNWKTNKVAWTGPRITIPANQQHRAFVLVHRTGGRRGGEEAGERTQLVWLLIANVNNPSPGSLVPPLKIDTSVKAHDSVEGHTQRVFEWSISVCPVHWTNPNWFDREWFSVEHASKHSITASCAVSILLHTNTTLQHATSPHHLCLSIVFFCVFCFGECKCPHIFNTLLPHVLLELINTLSPILTLLSIKTLSLFSFT